MNNKHGRSQWASKAGFILAAAGSAVGLGNLWKFPYLMGRNGGFFFLVAYLIFVCVLGLPIMVAEMSLGRKMKMDPVNSYAALNPKSKFVGVFGVLAAFTILSYYSIIGGWVMKYFFSYLTTFNAPADFGAFIGAPVEPIVWHGLFMLATAVICLKGVSGIEKASKVMMPGLFIILVIIVVRSLTLPGAGAGLAFMFSPASSQFTLSSVSAALGQVFYSLSLCMGISVTYGSYLDKKEDIAKSCMTVGGLDTLMAVLAGLAILPAVFAFGMEPSAGPGLIFGTLPQVFGAMAGGSVFAILFFLLVFFAAVTSSIALLEVVVCYTVDAWGWNRKNSVIIMGILIFLLGVPSSLSFGVLSHITLAGYTIFDLWGLFTDNLLLPLGGVAVCWFLGWKAGPMVIEEVESEGVVFKLGKAWLFCIRYITPVLVLIVTITGFAAIYASVVG